MQKKSAKTVLQDSTAAADVRQTPTISTKSINDAYDIGCELQRKRIECAIMIKAALADEEKEELRNMKKNKGDWCSRCDCRCFLGFLTYTAAVGFGPTGTGAAKNITAWSGPVRRCKHYVSGSG